MLANEDIQQRERFKTLQVELMRIFELSYELKNNYQQAGRLLQAEIPYDLFVAIRFERIATNYRAVVTSTPTRQGKVTGCANSPCWRAR